MPTVPQLDRSTINQQPVTQEIQAPRAIPGAFGERTAEAVGNLGKSVQEVGNVLLDHIQKQNYYRGLAQVSTDVAQFQQLSHDYRYTPGDVKITDKNGQDVVVSGGNELQLGVNTQGTSKTYFDKFGKEGMIAAIANKYKGNPVLYDHAIRSLNGVFDSNYDSLSQHEGTQLRKATSDSLFAPIPGYARDPGNTPELLNKTLGNIKDQAEKLVMHGDKTKEEAANLIDDWSVKAVENAANIALQKSGNLDQAKMVLDSASEKIPGKDYENILTRLETKSTHILEYSKQLDTQKEIKSEADLFTNYASGKLSWANTEDVANMVKSGQISQRAGAAWNSVLMNKGVPSVSNENADYPEYVKKLLDCKDQKELHSTLFNLLQSDKNMSQEKLSIIVDQAMQRGKSLPVDSNSLMPGEGTKVSPKQNETDAGAKSILMYGRKNGLSTNDISDMYEGYAKAIKSGKSPMDAYSMALRNKAIEVSPEAINVPKVGEPPIILNKKSNILAVFPQRKKQEKKPEMRNVAGGEQ